MLQQAPAARSKNWPRYLLPMLRPYRLQIGGVVMAILLDSALATLRPWPLKIVIDRVLSHKHTRAPLIGHWLNHSGPNSIAILNGACIVMLLITLGSGLSMYFYTHRMGVIGQHFVFDLRQRLFAHMQRLSLRFHDRQRTGDLLTRLTSDVQAVQELVSSGVVALISNLCLLLNMLGMMFWLNTQFALMAIAVTPLLFWTLFRYTRYIKLATRRARVSDGLLASLAQETLTSIRIVQGLSREERQDEQFRQQSANSLRASMESVYYQARVAPLVDMLSTLGLVIVMRYGALRVLAGEITTGDVVIFFAYVTGLYSPVKALSRLTLIVNKASIGAERITAVLEERSEVADSPSALPAPRFTGRLEFKKVFFAYEAGHDVLSNVDLVISPGERVAIVGASGAGKSTLVSLIPRLYDPSSGAVCLDNRDLRDFTIDSLREQISLVLQDALMFSGSIRDNITFGCPNATDAQVEAAARAANAHEFIQRLPEGYSTTVAERGSTLSGGQKQRIAIARAILRDAPILILDEPTSGLDAASERAVVDALEQASSGRTTLIIAHRLATTRFADRILVMEGGRIIEMGTPDELLATDGHYAQLCRLTTISRTASADEQGNAVMTGTRRN